jgi:hypothetical protein
MEATATCEALDRLRSDAMAALCEAKKIRRSRDVSIHEDAELSRASQRRIDALIKHLLAGHDGLPCPAGERPIVSTEPQLQKPEGIAEAGPSHILELPRLVVKS